MSDDTKFLKYRAKILAVNTGDQPDRLTQNITVPTFRGYAPGDVIPAGTLLRDIINKEFNSTPPQPKITITVSGSGTIIPAAGVQEVAYGADFTMSSATPASGQRLQSVTLDGNDITLPYTLRNVVADHTIRVVFGNIPTFTITASAATNGTISPSGSIPVTEGESKTFTITPDSGYQIKDVKVDGASVGAIPSYTFDNVTAPHTIAAEFEEIPAVTHTIVASAGTGGSISPSGNVTVGDGASQTFRIESDPNYVIDDVIVDGASQGFITIYTFSNVTADHTISVSFTYNPPTVVHTITASAGANGSINPSGAVSVDEGTNKSFTISPAEGYVVDDVLVDGASVGAVTTYQFTNVTTDHTIAASFKVAPVEKYHVVIADATDPSLIGAGTINPAVGTHDVAVGSSQAVTATPNSGFKIKSFKVDSTEQSISDPTQAHTYTVSGIAADATVNIIIEFEEVPADVLYSAFLQRSRSQGAKQTDPELSELTLGDPIPISVADIQANGYTLVTPPVTGKTYTQPCVIYPTTLGAPTSIKQSGQETIATWYNSTITISGVTYHMCYKNSMINTGQATYEMSWQ